MATFVVETMDIEEQKLKSKKANEQKRGETAQVNDIFKQINSAPK